jgi:hypothetical protein
VPASPGPDLHRARWLRRLLCGAAVGAPLGEWLGGTVLGSPSLAAGRAAVAPPGWASGDTGRQLPLKATSRGVRGRPILTEPGTPLLAGRALLETRAGRARGESRAVPVNQQPMGRPGSERCIRACVCSARGAAPPTPAALLCQACLGPGGPPYDSCSGTVLSRVRKLARTWFPLTSAWSDANLLRGRRSEAEAGVRAVRRGGAGALVPC